MTVSVESRQNQMTHDKLQQLQQSALSKKSAMLDKNLAIANRSRVSCAHNTSRAFTGLITPSP